MLKLTNHNKIYMITSTSLSSNVMTLTLNCDILDSTQVSVANIEPNDIKFRVKQKGAAPAFSLNPDGLYNAFSLNLRENFL